MAEKKKTDKGTEYDDLSAHESFDPTPKPKPDHPSPPIGPTPKGVGHLDFTPKDPHSVHPNTVPGPGHGPSDGEIDAVLAQLEAFKANLPHRSEAGTIGDQLKARETEAANFAASPAAFIDPDAFRVLADSVIAAIKWFREWRAPHRGA